jgi:hypothetical protein
MEEKARSVRTNGIYFGLLAGVGMIIFSLIMFITDLYMNKTVNWIGYLILIAGMIWGTLEYRKKYAGGFLSFGKAFGSCFWIGLIAGIIGTIYFFLFVKFIHPGFVAELLDQSRANMLEARPDMSEEEMEQALAMSQKFMSPIMMTIWGLVTYIAMSAILGLILGLFLKKEDPALKATM